MTHLAAGLLAFSLLGASGEVPTAPPKPDGGGIAPEMRVEPKPAGDDPEPLGRLAIGLRLHGPRFKIQGEGTKERPLLMDIPLGDFLKVRVVCPYVYDPPSLFKGALF